MIETLPLLIPNAQRGEHTIARCHERLARRRKRLQGTARANTRYLVVERVLIGGFCVIYICGIAIVAIQMLSGG